MPKSVIDYGNSKEIDTIAHVMRVYLMEKNRKWGDVMYARLKVKKIRFSSYIKLFVLASLLVGIVLGILGFVISLLGGQAHANIGSLTVTGIPAGIILIFLFPIFYCFFGLLFGLISYLPFKLILKKGFMIEGEFEMTDEGITEPNEKEEAE